MGQYAFTRFGIEIPGLKTWRCRNYTTSYNLRYITYQKEPVLTAFATNRMWLLNVQNNMHYLILFSENGITLNVCVVGGVCTRLLLHHFNNRSWLPVLQNILGMYAEMVRITYVLFRK